MFVFCSTLFFLVHFYTIFTCFLCTWFCVFFKFEFFWTGFSHFVFSSILMFIFFLSRAFLTGFSLFVISSFLVSIFFFFFRHQPFGQASAIWWFLPCRCIFFLSPAFRTGFSHLGVSFFLVFIFSVTVLLLLLLLFVVFNFICLSFSNEIWPQL